MAISKRKRFDVFKRDSWTCQYCGRGTPSVILQVDHVIAVSAGGDDSMENLVAACFDCNMGKLDRPLSDVPEKVAELMDRRKELASQVAAYNRFLLRLRKRDDETLRRLGWHWHNLFMEEKDAWVFGKDRAPSIRTFLKRLSEADIMDAMDIAHERRPASRNNYDQQTWKYFCGICWNKIKGTGHGE